MTRSQQNASSRLALTDDMASRRGAEDAILADQQLLDTVRSSNLRDKLDDLWIPVATVTANDEESTLSAFGDGEEDTCDEGLAVVGLLEDGDPLPQATRSRLLVLEGGELYGLDAHDG